MLALQLVPWLSFAPNLCLVFLLQLFVMQQLDLLGHMFLLHLPALPDRRQPGGDFVMVQRLCPGAKAISQALRGGGFV